MEDKDHILRRYKDGYFLPGGLYHGSNDRIFRYTIHILDKYKNELPDEPIGFITKNISIHGVALICDSSAFMFNEHYTDIFYNVVRSMIRSHFEIEKPNFMEYAGPCVAYYFGLEQYISENSEFRDYIKEVGNDLGYKKEQVKDYLLELLCGLAGYTYYHSLNPKIINDVAVTYMCNYRELQEIYRMNGISIGKNNLDNNFYKIFLNIFNNYKDMKKGNQRVIL